MNKNIIDQFNKLIKLIQIENSYEKNSKIYNINIFRIANLKKVLSIISNYKSKIINSNQLSSFKGIGKGTLSRIDEILKNGYLKEINELEKKYKNVFKRNDLINELSDVIGIGHSIASNLIDTYKIKSLDELIKKVNNGQIIVNDKIKLGLKYVGKYEPKIKRNIITEINNLILDSIKDVNIIICGSYRRGLPQSSDIDVLVCDLNLLFKEQMKTSNILNQFINKLKQIDLITDDITSSTVLTKYMGFCKYKLKTYRIDIRLVPYESLYPALIYFTGSYQLNTIMRINAKKLGYKLNEYGIYKNNELIYISEEKELFDILKMEYLEPEQRNIT